MKIQRHHFICDGRIEIFSLSVKLWRLFPRWQERQTGPKQKPTGVCDNMQLLQNEMQNMKMFLFSKTLQLKIKLDNVYEYQIF